jgi:hypothetical protein
MPDHLNPNHLLRTAYGHWRVRCPTCRRDLYGNATWPTRAEALQAAQAHLVATHADDGEQQDGLGA